MNWLGILGDAAGYCFALAFVIVIIVGYANGGKYRMSPWDPALLNEISPKGDGIAKRPYVACCVK